MSCVICKHGELENGLTTVILSRENITIVIKDVPAQICTNCGEYYLTLEMSKRLSLLAEDAIQKGAEVEIIHFAA